MLLEDLRGCLDKVKFQSNTFPASLLLPDGVGRSLAYSLFGILL